MLPDGVHSGGIQHSRLKHVVNDCACQRAQEDQGAVHTKRRIKSHESSLIHHHIPVQEPVVRCDLLQILNGCNARVALTVYRSGNGWLAYYPSTGAPPDPSTTYWGSLVPHMKMIAATIPSLEYAAAFKPDESELYESQEKQLDESIGSAATRNALLPAPKRPEATLWPAVPDETCEQKPTPSRLRIDVGWNLWQEEGEGTDLQYQVNPAPIPLPHHDMAQSLLSIAFPPLKP